MDSEIVILRVNKKKIIRIKEILHVYYTSSLWQHIFRIFLNIIMKIIIPKELINGVVEVKH